VFFFFCFLTNVIVSSMLILGGAAVMTSLTGMSTYAASFLIPVSVCVYTAAGGLKGTPCLPLCSSLLAQQALDMPTVMHHPLLRDC